MSEGATLDEAILALRAMRGDASDAARTLERISSTLERPSPWQRVVFITRLPARYYNGQAAAVVGLGLLLATSSYAAFFGMPTSLTTWWASSPRKSVPAAHHEAGTPVAPKTPGPMPVEPANRSIEAVSSAVQAQGVVPVAAGSQKRGHPASFRSAGVDSAASRASVDVVVKDDTPSTAQEADGMSPPERLYAEAHRLHFVIRDYSAALHAWERYLRVAPDAPLAVEARYNRALCLVRIGDHAAARSALTAIARGEGGAYRQREARALLRVLR